MVVIQISGVDVVFSVESTPNIVLVVYQFRIKIHTTRTDETVKLVENIKYSNIITWLVLDGVCLVREKDGFASWNLHNCI